MTEEQYMDYLKMDIKEKILSKADFDYTKLISRVAKAIESKYPNGDFTPTFDNYIIINGHKIKADENGNFRINDRYILITDKA